MKLLRVFVALVVVLIATSPIAYSLPRNESDIFYYSDDTYTEMVGEKFHGCDGSHYSWGITTQYQHSMGDSCESYGGWDCWAICDFDITTGHEDCYIISCSYW